MTLPASWDTYESIGAPVDCVSAALRTFARASRKSLQKRSNPAPRWVTVTSPLGSTNVTE